MDGKYSNAINRWKGVGPYYAMFPSSFATEVIKKYTEPGDSILDPFVGRGTSVYAAMTNGRTGLGVEINPVGWIYTKTKLSPASKEDVIKRLLQIDRISSIFRHEANKMPTFFHYCYDKKVLEFLLAARNELKWQTNKTDRTLMTFILISLHGRYGNALSNQMRQTKSMSPQYSINWWKERKLSPPKINPKDFFMKRIEWRYKKGTPRCEDSLIYLGDSSIELDRLKKKINENKYKKPKLLFTSPPYLGITNYHYDQWLRLWMLGYDSEPKISKEKYRGKFEDLEEYKNLIETVFKKSSQIINPKATVYVRTDYRKDTYEITKNVLEKIFPNKKLIEKKRMFNKPTQTQLFTKKVNGLYPVKGGEIDLIMVPHSNC